MADDFWLTFHFHSRAPSWNIKCQPQVSRLKSKASSIKRILSPEATNTSANVAPQDQDEAPGPAARSRATRAELRGQEGQGQRRKHGDHDGRRIRRRRRRRLWRGRRRRIRRRHAHEDGLPDAHVLDALRNGWRHVRRLRRPEAPEAQIEAPLTHLFILCIYIGIATQKQANQLYFSFAGSRIQFLGQLLGLFIIFLASSSGHRRHSCNKTLDS